MKKKNLTWLVILEICLLAGLVAAAVWFTTNPAALKKPVATEPTVITTAPATSAPTEATEVTTAPTTVPVTEAPTQETTLPEPVPEHFFLSFAGDCTLGTMYQVYGATASFPGLVGDNFDYPFAAVQEWFSNDDFTMVNLEGPLTETGTPEDKTFCFRGDPAFAAILPAGSV